jgi:hypothetical protein
MPKSPSVDIDALLDAHVRKRRGGTCTIALLLAELDPDVRAKVEAAFADDIRYASPGLAELMTQLTGQRVTGTTTNRHRRRECLCP